jgi:hypothetical protein
MSPRRASALMFGFRSLTVRVWTVGERGRPLMRQRGLAAHTSADYDGIVGQGKRRERKDSPLNAFSRPGADPMTMSPVQPSPAKCPAPSTALRPL